MCPHTTLLVSTIILCMRLQTTKYVSSYYCIFSLIHTICVLILLSMSPRANFHLTRNHTYTRSLSPSLSLSLSLSLTHSLTHSHSLSLTHTHTHQADPKAIYDGKTVLECCQSAGFKMTLKALIKRYQVRHFFKKNPN